MTPQQPTPRRTTYRAMLALACAAVGVGGYFSWQRFCRAEARTAESQTTRVRPELRNVDATVTSTGTIRLKTGAEVRVGAQISGLVKKLNVTVGSHIEKDEVIALIDSRGFEEKVLQGRAQIKVDRTVVHKLERQLARLRPLAVTGLIARQEAEDLEEDFNQAQARLDKSRSDLLVVESDRPYLTIRAPIAGTVASVSTQQGETIAAAFNAPTFVTIIEDQALELIAMIDETDIGAVRASNPVVFTTETYPSREFVGTVERIAPKATLVSGVVNYEVAIKIEKGLAALKPDMTANVTVQTEQHQALLIPAEALHRDGDQPFVYLARNGGIEKREVTAGPRTGSSNEIKKGLTANDEVLVTVSAADLGEKK